MPRLALVLVCVLLQLTHASCLWAQKPAGVPHNQEKPPGPALSPSDAVAKMTVPKGFQVELVAAEPDIVNPVAMTFDDRGRIWVTESLEYPRSSPGPGRDRIKVLEDTDHDGRVDKVTVFAEGLNIPSGIAVGYGGVWVANAPDLLFLQDTDGDGKADKQEVVVTGFGRFDTHELPNSLTWGPDGWLYGLNGVFNRSVIKYRGKEYDFTVALFRIHPRTRDFELFCQGTSNPWGVAFDTHGSAFISACVIDHLWHLTETGYYHRQGGPYPPFTWKLESIVKHKHQKAAYCGITFFDSDAYPPEYREKLYMGNIHGNCINVDKLARNGATYSGTPDPDFLSANDAWFMPVAQKTGPDGCLYVLDWYDQYHCYQDARRDPEGIERAKGRLYRVRYQNSPRTPAFDLAQETDDQLIERLASPNIYLRETAQRLLSERNAPDARAKLQALTLSDTAPKKARLHALWALTGTVTRETPLDPAFHQQLLQHSDETFRAWGVRAAGNARTAAASVLNRVAEMNDDPSVDVRLQVTIAALKLGFGDVPYLWNMLLKNDKDPLIPHIAWQNLHPLLEEPEHAAQLLTQIEKADLNDPALSAILPRTIERLLGRKQFTPAIVARLFALLIQGKHADVNTARLCLAVLTDQLESGQISGDHVQSVRETLQPILATIFKDPAHPLRLDGAMLAVAWKDATAIETVRQALVTPNESAERRLDALSALIAGKDQQVLKAAAALLAEEKESYEFRGQVLSALGRLDDPQVPVTVLAAYGQLPPELQPRAIELLTQRAPWSRQLLAAIGRKEIAPTALNVNQVRKLLASKDEELTKLVTAQWGKLREQRSPEREAVIADMRTFIRKNAGDAVQGREVFKKVCGQCHKLYGEGQEVGPDITVNGRSTFEQLLSNVFDPSLVIGASYQARTVVTNEGRVLTGLVAEESDQRIVLKVQGGKLETIPRGEIDETKLSELSLMPEGLEKQIKPQEIADLFAYITLDKPPEDPAAKQLPGVRAITPVATNDSAKFADILGEVAPGFNTKAVGEGGVALLVEHLGRPVVVRTHPIKEGVPCVLQRKLAIPAEKQTRLKLAVSHDPRGDWQLVVKADGKKLYDSVIGSKSAPGGWADISIDLTPFAGREVQLELQNFPNNWSYESAFWGRAEIVSQ